MVISCCYPSPGDSIKMGLAVISSRKWGVMNCSGEEEAHFDEEVGLIIDCAMMGSGVMLVCSCNELNHGVPGDVSKAQGLLEYVSPY